MNNKSKLFLLFFTIIGLSTTLYALRKKGSPEQIKSITIADEKIKQAKIINKLRQILKRLMKTYDRLKNYKKQNTKKLTNKEKLNLRRKQLEYLSKIKVLSRTLAKMEAAYKK